MASEQRWLNAGPLDALAKRHARRLSDTTWYIFRRFTFSIGVLGRITRRRSRRDERHRWVLRLLAIALPFELGFLRRTQASRGRFDHVCSPQRLDLLSQFRRSRFALSGCVGECVLESIPQTGQFIQI